LKKQIKEQGANVDPDLLHTYGVALIQANNKVDEGEIATCDAPMLLTSRLLCVAERCGFDAVARAKRARALLSVANRH
jgi:hypothetical protein